MINLLRLPITKVDEVQRIVYGTAALEQVDKVNEILDYATSKPHFEKWSGDIFTLTGGKSLGNVREMHVKSAVGKLMEFKSNDTTMSFEVAAKVVDEAAWQKVVEGVYTGFSLGGNYEKRWDDPTLKGVKRYTAVPTEISLVDNPCIPDATFEMFKADGTTELRKFAPSQEVPFQIMRRVIATGIVQKENMSALAKNCIKNYYPQTTELFKSMYDISRLADALQAIASIESYLESERDWNGIETTIPEMLGDILIQFKPIFLALAEEEISRLVREEERDAAAKMFFNVNNVMAKIISGHAELGKGVTAMKTTEHLDTLEKAVTSATSLDQLKKDFPGIFEKAKSSIKEGEGTADDLNNKEKVKQGEGAKETDKAVASAINKLFGVKDGEGISPDGLAKFAGRLEKIEDLEKGFNEMAEVQKKQAEVFTEFVNKVNGTPVMAAAAIATGVPVAKNADGSQPADTNLKKKASEYTREELNKLPTQQREALIADAFKEAQTQGQIGQPFPGN